MYKYICKIFEWKIDDYNSIFGFLKVYPRQKKAAIVLKNLKINQCI